MTHIFEGNLVSSGLKYGIVVGRFNEFITSKLLSGALDGLKRHGALDEEVDVAWVPGAFEIPLIASKMAESGKYDAVITLGTVIRGATSHYDVVCNEVAKGVAATSLKTGCSGHLRRFDDGQHRTGRGARRHQSRQQRLRGGGVGDRDGEPDEAVQIK